jgi:hypothetical protein
VYIHTIAYEEQVGVSFKQQLVDAPTLQQVEAALHWLDGQTRTLITLSADAAHYMDIGGGGAWFVVYICLDNKLFDLINPTAKDTAMITLIIGGQVADFPATMCVPFVQALQAATTFAMSGLPDPHLSWRIQ